MCCWRLDVGHLVERAGAASGEAFAPSDGRLSMHLEKYRSGDLRKASCETAPHMTCWTRNNFPTGWRVPWHGEVNPKVTLSKSHIAGPGMVGADKRTLDQTGWGAQQQQQNKFQRIQAPNGQFANGAANGAANVAGAKGNGRRNTGVENCDSLFEECCTVRFCIR